MNWFHRIFFTECETCKVLKEQIAFERSRNQELIETITEIVAPKRQEVTQSVPRLQVPSALAVMPSKVRARLEAVDRAAARVAATSPHLGKPDLANTGKKQIDELEKELGISTGVTDGSSN